MFMAQGNKFLVEYLQKISRERNRSEMLQDLVSYLQQHCGNTIVNTITCLNMDPSAITPATPPQPHNYNPPSSPSRMQPPKMLDRALTSPELSAVNYALSRLQRLERKYLLNLSITTPTTPTTSPISPTSATSPPTAPTSVSTPTPHLPLLLRMKFRAIGKRRLDAILKDLSLCNDELERRLQLNLAVRRVIQPTAPTDYEAPTVYGVTAPPVTEDVNGDPGILRVVSLGEESGDRGVPGMAIVSPGESLSSRELVIGDVDLLNPTDNHPPSPSHPRAPGLSPLNRNPISLAELDDDKISNANQSVRSWKSHERQDNYSIHTLDRICRECHQVYRWSSDS